MSDRRILVSFTANGSTLEFIAADANALWQMLHASNSEAVIEIAVIDKDDNT